MLTMLIIGLSIFSCSLFTILFNSSKGKNSLENLLGIKSKEIKAMEYQEKEIQVKDLIEDQVFLLNFPFKSFDGIPAGIGYHSTDNYIGAKDVHNNYLHYKNKFIIEILEGSFEIKSKFSPEYNSTRRVKNIDDFFSMNEYKISGSKIIFLKELQELCFYILQNTSTLNEDEFKYVNQVYYDFLYSVLKTLYTLNAQVSISNRFREDSIKVFRDLQEHKIMNSCETHTRMLECIKRDSEKRLMSKAFNYEEPEHFKFKKISSLIKDINESEDSFENCEIKVIADSMTSDIIPKLTLQCNSNSDSEFVENLNSTLDKIIFVLENSKSQKDNLKNELSIINRYLDSLSSSSFIIAEKLSDK